MVSSGLRSYCCHECRRRKVKCDGLKPACQRCTKRGKTCTGFPSTFKFLGNQMPGRDQIPSPKRRTTMNPERQTMITTCNKRPSHSEQTRKFPMTEVDTRLSHFNIQSFPYFRNIPPKSGIQCQDNLLIQEDAFFPLIDNPQQSLVEVSQFASQLGSAENTAPTSFSTSKSIYCRHHSETTHGRTTSSPHEWSTNSSLETRSFDSFIASPTYAANRMMTTNEIRPPCTPNIQLGSCPAFLADEQLEAYWEMLTSEYVASCQKNDGLAADSNSMPEDGTCDSDTNKGLGRLQLEEPSLDPDPDPDPERISCGDWTWKAPSPNDLYLCNFFV